MGFPRISIRRMMVYVAIFAIVPNVIVGLVQMADNARQHWQTCNNLAAHFRRVSAAYLSQSRQYPPDTVIPGVQARLTPQGPIIQATGKIAAQMAPYCSAAARIYDRAKWRLWENVPGEPFPDLPWPDL
jgi:hypothetical protein